MQHVVRNQTISLIPQCHVMGTISAIFPLICNATKHRRATILRSVAHVGLRVSNCFWEHIHHLSKPVLTLSNKAIAISSATFLVEVDWFPLLGINGTVSSENLIYFVYLFNDSHPTYMKYECSLAHNGELPYKAHPVLTFPAFPFVDWNS